MQCIKCLLPIYQYMLNNILELKVTFLKDKIKS